MAGYSPLVVNETKNARAIMSAHQSYKNYSDIIACCQNIRDRAQNIFCLQTAVQKYCLFVCYTTRTTSSFVR